MIRHGDTPPWEGESPHYGSWKPTEPMWDDTLAWEWVPPPASQFDALLLRLPFGKKLGRAVAWLEEQIKLPVA